MLWENDGDECLGKVKTITALAANGKNNSRHGLVPTVLRHTNEPLTTVFYLVQRKKIDIRTSSSSHRWRDRQQRRMGNCSMALWKKKSHDNNGVQHYVTGQTISHSSVWKLWFVILKMESICVTSQAKSFSVVLGFLLATGHLETAAGSVKPTYTLGPWIFLVRVCVTSIRFKH